MKTEYKDRLTGCERVPWRGNRDLEICINHWIFSIFHARRWEGNGEKLGKPAFSVPPSTGKKISLGIILFNISSGLH